MRTTGSEATPAEFYEAGFPGLLTVAMRRPGSGSAPDAIVSVNGVTIFSLGDDPLDRTASGAVLVEPGDSFAYQGPAGVQLFIFRQLDELPE